MGGLLGRGKLTLRFPQLDSKLSFQRCYKSYFAPSTFLFERIKLSIRCVLRILKTAE